MFLPMNDKQFRFWKMRRSGMSNVSIANLIGITRQGVSQALLAMDEKIEASLREMAKANRIQIEKIDVERGVLFGKSIPFQTNAYIFVSEKHGLQVWYEHDGDCISCDEFTKCIEFIWDFAAELGIKLEKTQDPTKMAEELPAKIREVELMIFISAIADWWLGLCRKPPKVCALPTGMVNSPDPAYEGSPDGGAGGSGTIRRGIGSAHSGMKTLIHNPQLLWFSLLAGLVLVGHIIAQGVLFVLLYSTEWEVFFHPVGVLWRSFVDPYYTDLLISLTVKFAVELSMVFCLVFLLAGLVLSSLQRKAFLPHSYRDLHGPRNTQDLSRGISLLVALTGTLLIFAFEYSSLRIWDFLDNMISLYPFYLKDFFARDVMLWGTEGCVRGDTDHVSDQRIPVYPYLVCSTSARPRAEEPEGGGFRIFYPAEEDLG